MSSLSVLLIKICGLTCHDMVSRSLSYPPDRPSEFLPRGVGAGFV
jgi:hypothetical protein